MSEPDPQLSEADLSAVTALADGRLPSDAATALRARLEAEPSLAAEFTRQRRALSLIRTATADVAAPLSLRERIEADRAKAPAPRQRRRWWLPAGAAGALGAAAVAVVLLFSATGAPSVTDVLRASTQTAAIGVSVSNETPQLLTTELEGVPFPNFVDKFGWKATGARTDQIDGRPTTTVFYEKDGQEIAYTIVGGDALEVPDGTIRAVDGKDFTVLEKDDRTAVTWQRGGRTCVLSADGVGAEELVGLAAWNGKGNVPF